MQKHTHEQSNKTPKKSSKKQQPEQQIKPAKGQDMSNGQLNDDSTDDADIRDRGSMEGEGSYTAGRNYDAETQKFARSGQVDKAGREAQKAVDGPDGEELVEAERVGKRGTTKH